MSKKKNKAAKAAEATTTQEATTTTPDSNAEALASGTTTISDIVEGGTEIKDPAAELNESLDDTILDEEEVELVDPESYLIDTSALQELQANLTGADAQMIRSAIQKAEEANGKIRMWLRTL